MSKLHELLAVENDLSNTAKKITEESQVVFQKKPELFLGFHKKLEMFDEDRQQDNIEEAKEVTTTVKKRLSYTIEHLTRYWDAVFQKEMTNQKAVADLTVDGKVIAEKVPATFLLGLETKLKSFRQLLDTLPTLAPGIVWEDAIEKGKDIRVAAQKEIRFKTEKSMNHKVLYDATDKHPAQIEKWEETKNIGKYVTETWSGMISPAEKSALIERTDKMLQEIKKARQRANNAEVEGGKICSGIFNYILS